MADDHGRLWVVRDRWSRDVVLFEDTWHGHIVPGHAALRGNEAAVARAIEKPHCVMHDAIDERRECFYARTLPGFKGFYIKVVVEFQPNQEGVVVTAYTTTGFRDDEVKRWP